MTRTRDGPTKERSAGKAHPGLLRLIKAEPKVGIRRTSREEIPMERRGFNPKIMTEAQTHLVNTAAYCFRTAKWHAEPRREIHSKRQLAE